MSTIPVGLLSAACYPPVLETETRGFHSLDPDLFSRRAHARGQPPKALRLGSRVAGQVDEFQHRAVGIEEIGAPAAQPHRASCAYCCVRRYAVASAYHPQIGVRIGNNSR